MCITNKTFISNADLSEQQKVVKSESIEASMTDLYEMLNEDDFNKEQYAYMAGLVNAITE